MSDEISRRLATFIANEVATQPIEGGLDPDYRIIDSGLVDSLGLFKVVAFVEEEFRIEIPPEQIVFENFESVAAIARLISRLEGQGAA